MGGDRVTRDWEQKKGGNFDLRIKLPNGHNFYTQEGLQIGCLYVKWNWLTEWNWLNGIWKEILEFSIPNCGKSIPKLSKFEYSALLYFNFYLITGNAKDSGISVN